MHIRGLVAGTIGALVLMAGPAFANCDPGEIVIKFSHVTNTDKHPKGLAASLLEQRVNEGMNGTACMQVFPNSQLYDDNKVLEALLLGDAQMAAPSLSKFEKYTKKFRIFDLPFLFEDIAAVERFQGSEAGEALKNSMRPRPCSKAPKVSSSSSNVGGRVARRPRGSGGFESSVARKVS